MKIVFRFVHALPNSWLPSPGKDLLIRGISAEDLARKCQNPRVEVVSHVRYPDHCERISRDLGITLKPSGENAPNPFNSRDSFVVASLSPGTTSVAYVFVSDATETLIEAGVI